MAAIPHSPDRLSVPELKEQILTFTNVLSTTNSTILYPILHDGRNGQPPAANTLRPPLSVVTVASGGHIWVNVVYELWSRQHVLFSGPEATSHRGAYETLLPFTDGIIHAKGQGNNPYFTVESGLTPWRTPSGGVYSSIEQ
ncbi:hypothetical protein CLAFUW4_03898 [Fulvia fulva]|uniref:Uncharacterized protein n=1 Tax=Passalora fulva TaxID=5499 RepID=A0A9Q8P5W9_PASFU|nr:uncharacterized protein CLAFUR5_03868 [Fulvia fulva]KAK4632870.1 hypothetical protein CLAFUR0_03885 [Fulvia fulva]UJO14384.1 hypothetical protein CLAFUR5_03868 [Fulvia fulva]WPV11852.1 hypothetical protein CLAFUW4_03898 [Fulvia fulva]